MSGLRLSPELEAELVSDIAGFQHDPLGFVLYVFPWGEGELSRHQGPRQWQQDVLSDIGQKLRDAEIGVMEAVQIAVASGHGIGKSALVSWVILWAMSTLEDTKGVVTANTENQLKTKTWAEVAKWHRLSIHAHWFKFTATAIFSNDPNHEKTWRIDMVPWSERNTEAFAGLHNEGKRVLLVFDEASGIPDLIWEVSEGALTDDDTEIIWCAFGNPTRNDGRFRQCFSRFRHRWLTRQIDSRSVAGTNKHQLQKWVDDYGEDSDFVRVRVRGEFPRVSDTQFISADLVVNAQERSVSIAVFTPYPKVLGVDVARFGTDKSVITLRQGPRVHWQKKFMGKDTQEVAAITRDLFLKEGDVKAICVDAPGVGAGVVDRLNEWKMPVVAVEPASTSPEPRDYINMRAWLWGQMKSWLETADLPAGDKELEDDIATPQYGYDKKLRIQIESKKDIKARGMPSPDSADSLMLTFAQLDAVLVEPATALTNARRRAQRGNWKGFT